MDLIQESARIRRLIAAVKVHCPSIPIDQEFLRLTIGNYTVRMSAAVGWNVLSAGGEILSTHNRVEDAVIHAAMRAVSDNVYAQVADE